MTKNGDYEVGYKKPPKAHRFKKGQSGNPKGRPKKKMPGAIDITDILGAPVVATISGKKKEISSFEAACRQLAKVALQGDLRSIIKFIRLCEEYDVIAIPAPISGGGVITAPKGVDFEEWFASVTEEVPHDE